MSGGSLDYAFSKVEEIAGQLRSRAKNLAQRTLAMHLYALADVLRDVEWELSGDTGEGSSDAKVEKFLGWKLQLEQAMKDALTAERDLHNAIEAAQKATK